MRLVGTIAIHLEGSLIQRQPNLWERLTKGLGRQLDLGTNVVRVELEATALVDSVRKALGRLGVTDALALVIDGTTIFSDSEGKKRDMPDLVIALSEHAAVFGRGFEQLKFVAEHEESALRLVIETVGRTQHQRGEPAALVSIGGRVRALEPRPSEEPEVYRQRVEPLTKDPTALEAVRLQFESFVARCEDALRAALPEARVEQVRAEARLVKPTSRMPAERAEAERDPMRPGYDPYLSYYPSPMGAMLDMMLLSSLMHSFHPSPNIFITSPMGTPLGTAEEVAAEPERLDSDVEAGSDPGGFDGDPDDGAYDDIGSHERRYDDGGGGFDDSGGGFDDGGGGFDGGGDFGGGFD